MEFAALMALLRDIAIVVFVILAAIGQIPIT